MNSTRFVHALSCFLVSGIALSCHCAAAPSAQGPVIIAAPGQLVSLAPPGTAPARALPDYDKDEDRRNEWSKKEFPLHGECRWLPTAWGGKPSQGAKVTTAERQAIQRENERIIAALKTAPVANPPIGICPLVASAGSDDAIELGFALRSSFWLANRSSKIYWRNKPGGSLHQDATLHLVFRFNTMPGGSDVAEFNSTDAEGEFFAAASPSYLFQGFPVYGGGDSAVNSSQLLVIPVNNRPLYRAVPLGRMLRWQLTQFDQELKQLQASMDGAKQEHDAFFAPAAQAEEERIIAKRIANERARTPEQQARIRANREAEVRANTARLRERWDAAAKPDHPFNIATRRKAEAQARLSSLAPADATSPACLIRREQIYITSDIGKTGDAKCSFALIERNPDYYDRSLPRTAIQLVTVGRFPYVPPQGGLPGSRYRDEWANQHMMWGLDWQKIRREVLSGSGALDLATVLPHMGTPTTSPERTLAAAAPAAASAPREPTSSAASVAVASQQSPAAESSSAAAKPAGEATIQTLLPVYQSDQLVEVRFENMPGGKRDWITIAPLGSAENQYGEWTYLNGQTSGTHKFSRLLKPGRYEVRAFQDWPAGKFGVKARSEFEVR